MAEDSETPVDAGAPAEVQEVDLSKPLARVDRPSKEKHDAEVARISDEMKALEAKRALVTKKIDEAKEVNKDSPLGAARAEFNELRAIKAKINLEKKVILDRKDELKAVTENLINAHKNAKGAIRYTKLEDIEKRVSDLRRRQETTSMSLTEEKKLIKEIEELVSSKKLVSQLATKEVDITNSKLASKDLQGAIKDVYAKLKDVDQKLDAKKAEIEALNEKESSNRSKFPDLIKERNAISKERDGKYAQIRKLRDEYRKANNDWYEYKKALTARKKAEQEIERKKRAEEEEAYRKKKEEEELKKVPYEQEMALCDYLANYLSTTYLSKSEEKQEVAAAPALPDDPFAGVQAANKKNDDVFLQMGGGKKKGNKKKKKSEPKAFNLSIDTFEQFSLLNLDPPVAADQVAEKVKELQEKKVWYTKQPRGSVPTANDIMKAAQNAQKKASKSSSSTNGESKSHEKAAGKDGSSPATSDAASASDKGKKKSRKKSFVFSNADFAPLGSGENNAPPVEANTSWGKAKEGN